MLSTSEYYNYPALNVSTLKLLSNPRWIKWREDNPQSEDSDKRHFRIGGALDVILTRPEDFPKEFSVAPKNRPAGLMGIFIDALPLDLHQESSEEEYYEAYTKAGYKANLSTVIKNLWNIPANTDYYISRKMAQGKTILSYDEYEEVMYCKENLLNNPYTRPYFQSTDGNVQVLYQVVVVFHYRKQLCKGMLDGVKIDHKNKIIYPFDLKTTGRSIKLFSKGYLRLGYYLQAAHYRIGLEKCLKDKEFRQFYKLPDNITEYKLEPLRFIVTEKGSYPSPAEIFTLSEEDHNFGVNGGIVDSVYYSGLNELIDTYSWHKQTNNWEFPKDLYENKGEVKLNLHYGKINEPSA